MLHEPARDIPILHEADLCVLGGSCTGAFAALRAARLGLRVVLVERANCLGGVATISLVNVWHSPLDEAFKKTIFAGLTVEVMERLKQRNAVIVRANSAAWAWAFNSFELMIELDEMIREGKIIVMFHTLLVGGHSTDGVTVDAVIVETKSGRGAIKAGMFIDATGDGDLCQRLGLETYTAAHFQPSTTCAILHGYSKIDWGRAESVVREHAAEFGLTPGFSWGAPVSGTDLTMLAATRVRHENAAEADALTRSEIEGRRQVRAILDLLRKYVPEHPVTLVGLPARIGIRETRHVRCVHQMKGEQVLAGTQFADAIANGSYRVDVHFQDKPGLLFKYLDGREDYAQPGRPAERGRWRPVTAENPTFYQIPYRALLPRGPFRNLLVAGRMIDADSEAHAAIRVMVNMNQTGEAAGTAAYLALHHGVAVQTVDAAELRTTLANGGSVML